MPKISSSEDVYRELVENSENKWLFGLVAFAIIEEQRIEWMQHFHENNGQVPSVDEVRHWYEQQPSGVLLRAKDTAETRLTDYADEVVQEILEIEREEIEEGVIVSEIRLRGSFWRQFGINTAAGLTSATLFAVILGVLAFIVLSDASPVKFGKWIGGPQIEEEAHGKTEGKSGSDK